MNYFFLALAQRAITAALACSEERALRSPVALPPFDPDLQEKCVAGCISLQQGQRNFISILSKVLFCSDFGGKLLQPFKCLTMLFRAVFVPLLNVLQFSNIGSVKEVLHGLCRHKSSRLNCELDADCRAPILPFALNVVLAFNKLVSVGTVVGRFCRTRHTRLCIGIDRIAEVVINQNEFRFHVATLRKALRMSIA